MTEHNHHAEQQVSKQKDFGTLYVAGAIIIAGIIIAGAVIFTNHSGSGAAAQAGNQQVATTVDPSKINTSGHPFIGKPDAPLTMVVWVDYQCPFCKQAELTVLLDLIKKYVDTGKMKVVFKNFTFLGNDSVAAAEYDRAVWDTYPEKYFEWRTAMFNAQDEEGDVGFGNAKTIVALIDKMNGVDAGRVQAAVAKNKDQYDKDTQADMQEASGFGINGTPAFVIGNQMINGANPEADFIKVIDAQLK